jgi:hypothetical protein
MSGWVKNGYGARAFAYGHGADCGLKRGVALIAGGTELLNWLRLGLAKPAPVTGIARLDGGLPGLQDFTRVKGSTGQWSVSLGFRLIATLKVPLTAAGYRPQEQLGVQAAAQKGPVQVASRDARQNINRL